MSADRVEGFTMHDAAGHAVLRSQWLSWVEKNNGAGEFGKVTRYTWKIRNREFSVPANIENEIWHELPDGSGFICFETKRNTDNCYVRDAYGRLRYRLRVPWELTEREVPRGAETWFRNTGEHQDGNFGVTAWIEYAGDYYFELDYHAGKFLWGRKIRY